MKARPEDPVRKKPQTAGGAKITKLPTVPKGSKIHKRPLPHAFPTPPARSVYVSSKAPFMSLIKRVRKKLDHDAGGQHLSSTKGLPLLAQLGAMQVKGRPIVGGKPSQPQGKGGRGRQGAPAASSGMTAPAPKRPIPEDDETREVKVYGSGKAIEKTLEVAGYFARQNDCVVSIRTGSVSAVDEVELPDGAVEKVLAPRGGGRRLGGRGDSGHGGGNEDGDMDVDDRDEGDGDRGAEDDAEEEGADSFRVRMVTYVEVGVRYRC